MKLHDLDLSGNAYKVRLFLSLIGREATLRPVDFLNASTRPRPSSA